MAPYNEFSKLINGPMKLRPEKVWEAGRSNKIYILGKAYDLIPDEGAENLVINFKDDPSMDFGTLKSAETGQPLARPRSKKIADFSDPNALPELKKLVNYVVMHTDVTYYARATWRALRNQNLSSHFCINWNGIIYQYCDAALRTAHALDHNKKSIGIDMNSPLVNLNNPAKRDAAKTWSMCMAYYKTIAKEEVTKAGKEMGWNKKKIKKRLDDYNFEQPVTARIQGGRPQRTWGYTPRQYKSLIALLKLLVRVLDIDKHYPMMPNGAAIPTVLEDDDKKQIRGFVAHWHLSTSRWDPGPAFNWKRVLSGLQNEYNWFPLAWKESLILQGRQYSEAVDAAYELVRNTETEQAGGTFPIGPNQTWHGGVHLFPPFDRYAKKKKRYAVHAMFDGEVVAAHFERGRRAFGHNNFVVLRHEIKVPKPKAKRQEDGSLEMQTFKFFSLYMHLDSMAVDEKAAGNYPDQFENKRISLTWLKRMYDFEALAKAGEKDKLDAAVKSLDEQVKAERAKVRKDLDLGKEIDEERAKLVVRADDDMDESQSRAKTTALEVGFGPTSLKDQRRIAILSDGDWKVKVVAGEVLGFAGLLPGPDGGAFVPGIHVEIFSSREMVESIDLELHAEHFRTPQRARGSNLTVATEDILMIFRNKARYKPNRKVQIWPGDRIDPDEIKDFYASETRKEDELYREQLRRSITYHVSEWSDQVDWLTSLTGGQPWGKAIRPGDFKTFMDGKGLFSEEIRRFLPYVWLTQEVADGIGLRGGKKDKSPWDGRVYHFHPIHFVMWVSFHAVKRQRIYNTALSLASLRRRQYKDRAVAKLVKSGKAAKAKGGKTWQRWQSRLNKKLRGRPFYFKKGERDTAKIAARDQLKAQIMGGVEQEVQQLRDERPHGVVENLEPMFSKPTQVLDELFDLEPHIEWDIARGES